MYELNLPLLFLWFKMSIFGILNDPRSIGVLMNKERFYSSKILSYAIARIYLRIKKNSKIIQQRDKIDATNPRIT